MATDLRKRFGRLVAANRRNVGLTQQALADKTGISIEMIGRIETGTSGARFPNIQLIADALNVDPSELFRPQGLGTGEVRPALVDMVTKLAGLTDHELAWVDNLLDAALKARK